MGEEGDRALEAPPGEKEGGGVNGKRAHTEKNSLHPGYFCSNVLNLERAIY